MVKKSVRKKVAGKQAADKQAATEKPAAEEEDAAAEEVDEEAEHDEALKALPSHQKRKVTKRAKFLEKIRVATVSKIAKASSKKKKGLSGNAFADFATLEATLSDIAGVKGLSPGKNKNKVKVLRSKARTKLVESETGRMQAVLSHPQFQTNPIAAMTNHILASLKKDAAGAPKPKVARVVGGKGGKGGGKGGKVVDVKVESDEVALATQRRGASASARGIGFAGDGAGGKRGAAVKEGALGVTYSNAKKHLAKQGAKKGSKRSKKKAGETW